jgi:hypothetical protein
MSTPSPQARSGKGAILDPISDPEIFTLTKMGVDATRPVGRDFAERVAIEEADRARADLGWRRDFFVIPTLVIARESGDVGWAN